MVEETSFGNLFLILLLCCSEGQKVIYPQKGHISSRVAHNGLPMDGAGYSSQRGIRLERTTLGQKDSTGSAGTYKILMMHLETYRVAAVKYVDGNSKYDPGNPPP